MITIKEQTIQTDVLVIGAGGAGLRAAIAAKSSHVDVLVVSKGVFPNGCNTARAGGAMLAPLGKADSTEKYIEDILRAGSGMNYPGLVAEMAAHAGERALDLERFGARYPKKGGEVCLWPSNDNSVSRILPAGEPYSGDWLKILTDEAHRCDIAVRDRFVIMSFLQSGRTVVGAVGFEIETEAVVAIYAKSVILATGGAGSMYAFTSNTKGITGDGMIMAYRAGAALSHLEFVQMRQCIIHPEGLKGMLPPFDGFVSAGGRFYNGRHERYMRRYHPDRLESVTRAEIAKCAQLEIIAGRQGPHGGVFGDLSDVPRTSLERVKKFIQACRRIDFDPTFQSLEWAPAAHHTMGGIVINSACQTGVLGLYAAGEVAAGVQGANRIGGNALTETQVFGAIAGEKAAERAKAIKAPTPDSQCTQIAKTQLLKSLNSSGGIDYQEVRSRIKKIMSMNIGVIRHESGLRHAQAALSAIESKQINDLFITEKPSLGRVAELLEVKNMLVLGQLMVQAAQLRTESRGAHQRQDFPNPDPRWQKHIIFRRSMTGPEVNTVPAFL